jgi:hypothetical protein
MEIKIKIRIKGLVAMKVERFSSGQRRRRRRWRRRRRGRGMIRMVIMNMIDIVGL